MIGGAVFLNGLLFLGIVDLTPIGVVIASILVWFDLIIVLSLIINLFTTQKLRIDESEISLFLVIFCLRCFASTASRQHLDRIELVPPSYVNTSFYGGGYTVRPYINIWAGKKQFCLSNYFNLTQAEQGWLIHELTEWLDLPN